MILQTFRTANHVQNELFQPFNVPECFLNVFDLKKVTNARKRSFYGQKRSCKRSGPVKVCGAERLRTVQKLKGLIRRFMYVNVIDFDRTVHYRFLTVTDYERSNNSSAIRNNDHGTVILMYIKRKFNYIFE
jgi:hypothetical protein